MTLARWQIIMLILGLILLGVVLVYVAMALWVARDSRKWW